MNYEKAYNDLIARINAVKNAPKIDMIGKHHYDGYVESGIRDALNYILNPESEDERIRKTLLRCCDDWDKGQFGCMKKEDIASIRAYLEKQKDLAAIPDELVKNYKLFCEQGGRELALLINAINSFNKMKEQQPAEWSEEDGQWLESIIKDYEDSLVKDKDHAAIIEIKIDFLKSLRPQPHWKPSEEQDECH